MQTGQEKETARTFQSTELAPHMQTVVEFATVSIQFPIGPNKKALNGFPPLAGFDSEVWTHHPSASNCIQFGVRLSANFHSNTTS